MCQKISINIKCCIYLYLLTFLFLIVLIGTRNSVYLFVPICTDLWIVPKAGRFGTFGTKSGLWNSSNLLPAKSSIFGTGLWNIDPLGAVERDPYLCFGAFPAADAGKDGRDVVGIDTTQIGSFLAEAFTPDFHIGYGFSFYSAGLLFAAELAAV